MTAICITTLGRVGIVCRSKFLFNLERIKKKHRNETKFLIYRMFLFKILKQDCEKYKNLKNVLIWPKFKKKVQSHSCSVISNLDLGQFSQPWPPTTKKPKAPAMFHFIITVVSRSWTAKTDTPANDNDDGKSGKAQFLALIMRLQWCFKCLRCVKICDCQICYFYAHLICVSCVLSRFVGCDESDISIVNFYFHRENLSKFLNFSKKVRDKFKKDCTYWISRQSARKRDT